MKSKGFSLVELSIVLIIIGLLVSGAVSGSKLIETTRINNIINQISEMRTSASNYLLVYNALPGDHSNATDYWGTASNCYADTTGTSETCDGDGSGKLSYVNSGDTSNTKHESWHFWKHLSNSEIIVGNFSAYSDDTLCTLANYCMDPGKNVLEGAIKGTGWFAFSVATFNGLSWQGSLGNPTRNIIALTNANNQSGRWYGSSLTPRQQYRIDNKIDDAHPYKGKIVDMSGGYSTNCATIDDLNDANVESAEYDLTYTDVGCMLFVDL